LQNEFVCRNRVVQSEVVEQTENDLVCVSWRWWCLVCAFRGTLFHV